MPDSQKRILSFAAWANPRLAPLIDGTLQTEGLGLDFENVHPSKLNPRLRDRNDLDVFETSLIGLIRAGRTPPTKHQAWVGLPLFLSRSWFPLSFDVAAESPIRTLDDLAGKRFGIPSYHMPAAVWLRIILKQVMGTAADDIVWVVPSEVPPGGPPGAPPLSVKLETGKAKTSRGLLLDGEVDAAFYGDGDMPGAPKRTAATRQLLDKVATLATARQFYKRSGAVPLNHAIAMQARLEESEPGIARRVFGLIERCKRDSYRQSDVHESDYLLSPDTAFEREVIGEDDPFPSGIARNRRSLALFAEQALADGLIAKPAKMDELFTDLG